MTVTTPSTGQVPSCQEQLIEPYMMISLGRRGKKWATCNLPHILSSPKNSFLEVLTERGRQIFSLQTLLKERRRRWGLNIEHQYSSFISSIETEICSHPSAYFSASFFKPKMSKYWMWILIKNNFKEWLKSRRNLLWWPNAKYIYKR